MSGARPLGSSYLLYESFGRGAMGEVYRAAHRVTEEPLAVKVLRRELTADTELVTRFMQERAILLDLKHPHLVQVHDLVAEGDTLAIVMDLVPGHDLRAYMRKRGTLAPALAARLVQEVLSALAVVHAEGVVHRDIKPENILLDLSDPERPSARLSDFGIARVTFGPSLTRLTGLIGTPEYMAPEMAEQESADPAADLYAVGIVLYEVLTGRSPFAGGHPVAVLRRHLEDKPVQPAGLPQPLWEFIETLLAKDPGARPTAAEAERALSAILPGLVGLLPLAPAVAPPKRPARVAPDADGPAPVPASLAAAAAEPVGVEGMTRIGGRRAVPEAAPEPTPDRKRNRWLPAAVAAAVLAAFAVTGAVVTQREDAVPASASEQVVDLDFAPVAYRSGLVVSRTWHLDTAANRLEVQVKYANGGPRGLTLDVDEHVPTVFQGGLTEAEFEVPPTRTLPDGKVQYSLRELAPGHFVRAAYRVDAPDGGEGLPDWAADHIAVLEGTAPDTPAGYKPPAILSTLTTEASALVLPAGSSHQLKLVGTMNDGTEAPPSVMAAVAWRSADPEVARIDNGRIRAVSPGQTEVAGLAGPAQLRVQLQVVPQGQAVDQQPPAQGARINPPRPQQSALLTADRIAAVAAADRAKAARAAAAKAAADKAAAAKAAADKAAAAKAAAAKAAGEKAAADKARARGAQRPPAAEQPRPAATRAPVRTRPRATRAPRPAATRPPARPAPQQPPQGGGGVEPRPEPVEPRPG